jgi:hypothetical protein
MKKLLVFASAASALAIVSGAIADDFQIRLTSTVPQAIRLVSSTTSCTPACSPTVAGSSGAVVQNVSLSLLDQTGHLATTTGVTLLTLNANTAFKTTVYSSNGGLTNGTDTVPYEIWLVGSAPNSTDRGSSQDHKDRSSALGAISSAGSSTGVNIHFTITAPGDSPKSLSAGTYDDIMHLDFTPL